ncbi:tRNA epoxyqueuosine(34) reductase QueG [Camelimonas sp. ID_303_24]
MTIHDASRPGSSPPGARQKAPASRKAAAGPAGLSGAALRKAVVARALAEGFDVARVAPAAALPETGARLLDWLDAGYHGDMEWMRDGAERRASPQAMWPEARSALVLGLNYGPDHNPLDHLAARDRGLISVYAQGRDYHEVIKGRLKQVAGFLASRGGADVKVFVDTAPLMEKPLAALAGVGWQGKHSVLVSRSLGNWLFLGVILTTAELPPDPPGRPSCGSCRACLDICPTSAFPAPYQLDSRRCISYLTIEHAGPVPHAFRKAIGNRIFGCDDCLAVCPWNKFAQAGRDAKLAARAENDRPALAGLLSLDDAAFRTRFAGTPVRRAGRDRFLRNVLIATGNSGDRGLAEPAARLLDDASALVRGAAVWALGQLLDATSLGKLRRQRVAETDPDVLAEWELAAGLPTQTSEAEQA